MPGNGVLASRSHFVVTQRALRPNPLAQRSISATPIGVAELMTDLLRIDTDPLKTQQHDQGGKTRVRRRSRLFAVLDHLRLNFAK